MMNIQKLFFNTKFSDEGKQQYSMADSTRGWITKQGVPGSDRVQFLIHIVSSRLLWLKGRLACQGTQGWVLLILSRGGQKVESGFQEFHHKKTKKAQKFTMVKQKLAEALIPWGIRGSGREAGAFKMWQEIRLVDELQVLGWVSGRWGKLKATPSQQHTRWVGTGSTHTCTHRQNIKKWLKKSEYNFFYSQVAQQWNEQRSAVNDKWEKSFGMTPDLLKIRTEWRGLSVCEPSQSGKHKQFLFLRFLYPWQQDNSTVVTLAPWELGRH